MAEGPGARTFLRKPLPSIAAKWLAGWSALVILILSCVLNFVATVLCGALILRPADVIVGKDVRIAELPFGRAPSSIVPSVLNILGRHLISSVQPC